MTFLRCTVWRHPGTFPVGFQCLLERGHAGDHQFAFPAKDLPQEASVKYVVTDQHDRYLLTAPLHVIVRLFSFTKSAIERVERETAELNGICKVSLNFSHYEFRVEWSPIHIRRLPIEIPQPKE